MLAAGFAVCGSGLFAQTVFINEIHYDDAGGDTGEGVEVAGPAGTDLTGWTLIPYNGSNGQSYTPSGTLSGSIPDLGGGYGAVFFAISGLQNGAPDGIALYDGTTVIQFLSYEGSFTATNGVANGMTSTDIGVSEGGSVEGSSLQLTGNGTVYTDFTWAPEATSTYNAFNNGQTFGGGGCGITIDQVQAVCNDLTAGVDDYTLSISYFGVDASVTVVYAGSGTVAGSDPAVDVNGTIIISGIPEGEAYSVSFSAPCDGIATISGSSPVCEPPACGITLGTETVTCLGNTVGDDTYEVSIPYTGVQVGTTVLNNSGSGSISGDDPASVADGTIIVTGISEADAYSIALTSPCEALSVSGSAPVCDPLPTLTVINFDEAANWTAGSAAIGSYASDHTYVESGWSFTGGPALRNGTAVQDGVPGALDVFSWRMNQLATVDWRATYNGTETLTQFGFDVRRWDASPDPNFEVSYSVDGGSNFSSALVTINNTFLDNSSAWKTYSYAIPAPAQYAPGNFVVRVLAAGTTERIMIDNFSFDTGAIACALGLGSPSVSCDGFTAGPGNDTYTVTINYTGVQAGATVINNSGSGSVSGNDPSTEENGTIIVSGITEGSGYSITFDVPCETLVISGSSPSCEPPPSLVINEVDYDQPGTDAAEFVELKNTGATPVDLTGLKLILVNGSTDSPYGTPIILPNTSLAAGDYYVIGSSSVPNVDLVAFTTDGIQNGSPDGIRLLTANDNIIDQMSYEGDMSSTEGTGAGTDPNNTAGASLCRIPDGSDTDDNSVDFVLSCSTPGEANAFVDSDSDGTPDCLDLCPGGPEPGSPCDDGDEFTADDTVQNDCSCLGIALDCEGVPGGPATPGTECDDLNPGTINDVYQLDCTCAGVVVDCLGIPGGPNLPGAPCNDFDPSTNDETYNEFCACVGTPCSQNVVLDLRSDVNSDQISWEILYQNDATVVCSGGGYLPGITDPIVESCCLPIGCFRLRVSDSGGDGFVTGGYQLRESGANGRRIIDNFGNFTSGSTSAIGSTYENGAFCVPIGDIAPIFSSCDKLDWVNNKFIVCHADPAVSAEYGVSNATSGYEFWFFDPNGGYSFRRFRSHATSDGYGSGATRACHFKINGWYNSISTPHIPADILLNVRVRGRVAGSNLPFGPACQFKIDAALAACPRVKLQDDPANTSDYSCGVSRNFGGSSNPNNRIYANPPQPIPVVASSAVRYQFRFRITGENVCIVRPPQTSARMVLNWTNGTPLECNRTYEVDVRVSLDGGATWCFGPAGSSQAAACADTEDWGKVCLVTINPCALPNGGGNALAGNDGQGVQSVALYPNPNRGDQLFVSLSNVQEGVNTVNVDVYDLTGKRVMARTIAVQDGFVKTNLDLNGDLSGGMYMVNITSGDKTYTERLVIQP
ncbi:MAG: lamin tail domain-containing protein [Flavobacteriales bacterium]